MNLPIFNNGVRYFCFAIFSAFIVLQVDVGYPVTDTFHEGEYVGLIWHILSYYEGRTTFPLVIHGAMDFAPSLIAKVIYGENSIIVGTRIANSIIVITTWVFFLDFCWRVIENPQKKAFMISIPMLLILLASKNWGIALALHHAFIGPRDLFLIISLWAFVSYEQSDSGNGRIFYTFVLISAAIVGLYWSYDRGLMAAIVALTFSAKALLCRRRMDARVILAVTFFTFSILEYTKIFGSVLDISTNIFYWIKSSKDIWGNSTLFPISLQPMMLPISLAALLPLVFFGARNDLKLKRVGEITVVLILVIVEVFMIKTIFNRAGLPRTSWGLWPLIAIFLYGASRLPFGLVKLPSSSTIKSEVCKGAYILLLLVPVFALSITYSNYFYSYPNFSTFSQFKSNLISPKRDIDLVSGDVKKVSLELSNLEQNCAFSWTNEGVITLIARLPVCTRFSYLVYAKSTEQSRIIEQLVSDNPSAIVVGSPNWSLRIDERSMQTRLPEVNSYIIENYPFLIRVGEYEIRSKNPQGYLNYKFEKLYFSTGKNGEHLTSNGWSHTESWGVWSQNNTASVILGLPSDSPLADYEISITAQGFTVEGRHPKQNVDLIINNKIVGSLVYDSSIAEVKVFKISKEQIYAAKSKYGILEIKFRINNAISPSDLGLSGDTRKLGIGLISMQIKPFEI
jgi:hypothetical protein